jgi:hypothetical protein
MARRAAYTLHAAAWTGDTAEARQLLAAGAAPDKRDRVRFAGRSCLDGALLQCTLGMPLDCAAQDAGGLPLSPPCPQAGMCALSLAACRGHTEVMTALLDAGADVNVQDGVSNCGSTGSGTPTATAVGHVQPAWALLLRLLSFLAVVDSLLIALAARAL